MTPEAQRIAIAEACGWKKAEPPNTPVWWKDGQWVSNVYDLPDYLNDLNAMHEAWLTLDPDRQFSFNSELSRVLLRSSGGPYSAVNAAAAQRAEAFLRTIGKWEDSK